MAGHRGSRTHTILSTLTRNYSAIPSIYNIYNIYICIYSRPEAVAVELGGGPGGGDGEGGAVSAVQRPRPLAPSCNILTNIKPILRRYFKYLPVPQDDILNNKLHIKTKENGCIFENLYVSQFLHQQHFLYNTIHF